MTKFKELLLENAFHAKLEDASVTVTFKDTHETLFLKFDSKDIIHDAKYTGKANPWLSSLCFLLIGKGLQEALAFDGKMWEETFKEDQTFWDMKQEEGQDFFNRPLELLHAALDIYQGRDYLYKEESPLICRCFGIREKDVLEYLQKNETPTLEGLCGETKAGMGCRSCVPQIKRWVSLHEPNKSKHYFKEKALSEWLLEIDHALSTFPEAKEWQMEVQSFKGNQVEISFEKTVPQKEEEEVSRRLQGFLGSSVDPDLGFFLRRARHFSKARG